MIFITVFHFFTFQFFTCFNPTNYRCRHTDCTYNNYHLVSELENYYEDYNLHLNAENCLRKKFLNNRPKGYSKSKILSMTTDELLDLDQSLQWYNPSKDESN